MTGIDRIERGEICHIGEEAGGLHYIFHGQACRSEDGFHIFRRLFCLRFHRVAGELARSGVDAQLAGAEYQISRADSLGIRTDSGRCVVRMNDFHTMTSFVNPAFTISQRRDFVYFPALNRERKKCYT